MRAPSANLRDTPTVPMRAQPANLHDTPAEPVRAPAALITPAQSLPFHTAASLKSAPPPQKTDVFSLPSAQKAPVPLVRFAPLRGVRRERLRREADEARAKVAEGQPVRLTHVVELPQWPEVRPIPAAASSPAVGEAARKFAPDLPMGTPDGVSISPAPPEPLALLSPEPEPEPENAPAQEAAPSFPVAKIALQPAAEALLAQHPAIDDRDQFVESATMQVEPLSNNESDRQHLARSARDRGPGRRHAARDRAGRSGFAARC